jgi:protein-tyrosine phosphatase
MRQSRLRTGWVRVRTLTNHLRADILGDMFRILFVCTGNRCRSPVAEEQLRRLAQGLPVEVGSVGLLDLGSAPALPEVLEVGRGMGLDLSRHRSRHLMGIDLSEMDLVVGLERSHVAAAVVEANVPYEKVFTFKEIVRLLRGVEPPDASAPEERARMAVKLAHEQRNAGPAFTPGEDIEDPFGGTRAAYTEMATTVARLARDLLSGLFGQVPARAGLGRPAE